MVTKTGLFLSMHSLKNQTNDLDIALPTQESPSEDHPWNPKCCSKEERYKMITQQQMWYTADQDYSQIP